MRLRLNFGRRLVSSCPSLKQIMRNNARQRRHKNSTGANRRSAIWQADMACLSLPMNWLVVNIAAITRKRRTRNASPAKEHYRCLRDAYTCWGNDGAVKSGRLARGGE